MQSNVKLLLVEDNPMVLAMLRDALSPLAHVTTAGDGADALLKAVDEAPDLLVSDYRMPGINGLELIHRCKLIHPTLKVIAASANILDEEIEKYPFRPDRILPKPYSTEGLLAMVKSLLPD